MLLCMTAFSFENFPTVNQSLVHRQLTLESNHRVVTCWHAMGRYNMMGRYKYYDYTKCMSNLGYAGDQLLVHLYNFYVLERSLYYDYGFSSPCTLYMYTWDALKFHCRKHISLRDISSIDLEIKLCCDHLRLLLLQLLRCGGTLSI